MMMAAAIAVLGSGASGGKPVTLERVVLIQPTAQPDWQERLSLVDQSIARSDLSRSMYEWREAYAAAVASRRWDAMAEVGDRAVRISQLAGGSAFWSEARKAYRNALFRARAQRSVEGMRRAAEAFEKLGDSETAAEARRMAEGRS
jgi:hypothetical protein